MARVLILTSSSGAGHNQVATALSEALSRTAGDSVQTAIADPFLGADLPSRIVRLYAPAIVRASWAWGLAYQATNHARPLASLAAPLEAAVASCVQTEKPDLVVSVHPLCHRAAVRVLRRAGLRTPVVVLITDLMDVHLSWLEPEAAFFIAPTAQVTQQLIGSGFPSDRIHCAGLPVHQDFRAAGGDGFKRSLGLDPDRPVVLLTGGGEGAGPLEEATLTAVEALPNAQTVVVCGRNEKLRRRLVARQLPARILGFIENMARWVRACDVVVGKAGALTVVEAVAARRPLVIIDALPGQERGNLKYVLNAGIGVHAPPARPLARALQALESQAFRPLSWIENMASVDYPRAPEQAARLVLEKVYAGD